MTSVDKSDKVWINVVNSDKVSSSLTKFGQIWTSLDKFEQVWTSLNKIEQDWTSLGKFKIINVINMNSLTAFQSLFSIKLSKSEKTTTTKSDL